MMQGTTTAMAAHGAMQIESLDAFVFRAPADPPVQTSFGIMHDRPAVLLRLRDKDGAEGWGEVWCNFPTVGAEHRARLALAYGAPVVTGRAWAHPREAWETMLARFAVLMLQTGEPGPLHQIAAGIDMAMWDLFARRAGMPAWRALGGESAWPVPVYASGINPTEPEALALAKRDEGYRAFKLKVGFGEARDMANLRGMRDALGGDTVMMVDANQAWTPDEAIAAGHRMAQFGLLWLEEPVRADEPPQTWERLAREQPLRLAGGENLSSMPAYEAFIAQPGMSVIQPDAGKWGGLSGCIDVARRANAAGKWYCPHWLGAGMGLVASLHLKTAAGGEGYVEVDANANVLRDTMAAPVMRLEQGCVTLPDAPGFGVVPDLAALAPYAVDFARG
ncbi:mandelate racemase/muconate lactonizing enzyme family protein [Cupriavidus respiraculi]|uniref:D-galactarolactone cycloisomerase n=1 Tax=Cupriavidus respiraculi TaxID=195930 RepID=A0ABM8WH48_9BURK|nr:mandelate racemase/muconate lactonizing enzyme family protein [Cupriavidus respiraculi]CAG9166720.1 D-galactarolactone cycloisomerase [Cupriavidus respiraculi]